jgi:YidC/Oxa1 family membrane protein insertase
MEEKKLDRNTIIGFSLMFVIMMWIFYQQQPTKTELAAKKAKQEQLDKAKQAKTPVTTVASTPQDVQQEVTQLQTQLGSFANAKVLSTDKPEFVTLENNLIKLSIATKGGYISEATLKSYEKFKKGSGQLVQLIKDNNSDLNIKLQTTDGKTINTKELHFVPKITKSGENQILTMQLVAAEKSYLQYQYVLKPNDYMLDFNIQSQGLTAVANTTKPANLEWSLKTFRNEKSISYENRFTDLRYQYEDEKTSYVGEGTDKEENPEKVSFIAFKQHFFSSILLTETPFAKTKLKSNNLVVDEQKDSIFTKQFTANIPLAFNNGDFNQKMNLYFGPTDYKLLKSYKKGLDEIIPLGWGIFGWINKYIFFPLFGFLSSYMSYGITIIIFTIIIKMAMSPITYKSFLSSAKMKVLRPEINELNEKFSKDPMKKQQETMKLYNKAGVNPMAGCIPALIQLPFVYASFQFFPSAFQLRQKNFLWSDDLSSFDSVLSWKQHIPLISNFYGNHVSLFALLAAIAIFFYTKMTSGDQQMQAPTQEGMPDMGKIMKIMIYLSPIMMLIFFNNYGSGLSLYNFMSNLITIGIMFVIKNYIVDDKKIHAQIEVNKTKEPKKQGKFQRKLQEVMEQAEAQKAQQKKK